MPKMGDSGPLMVDLLEEGTGALIASLVMSQVPQMDEQVELQDGAVYKVEVVRYVFTDATEGGAVRVACKAALTVSVV